MEHHNLIQQHDSSQKHKIFQTMSLSSYDYSNDNFIIDSGYNSGTFTPNNTPNFFPNSTERYCQNSQLLTIEEDINESPLKASTSVTPTTQNIRKMDALHLNTSLSKEIKKNKISPLKRISTFTNNENLNITPKKTKQNENKNEYQFDNSVTPRKLIRKPSFQEKLDGKIEYSPITVNNRKVGSVLKEKSINENLMNSLSTSTPKNAYRSQHYIEKSSSKKKNDLFSRSNSPKKKNHILKKFQSFSPVSYIHSKNLDKFKSNIVDINLVKKRLNYQTDEKIPVESLKSINNNKRGTLTRQNAPRSEEQSLNSIIEEKIEEIDHPIDTKGRLSNARNSLELIPEYIKRNISTPNPELTPEFVRRDKNIILDGCSFNFPEFNTSISHDNLKGLLTEPILLNKSDYHSPPRTPIKSLSPISGNLNPEKEWNEILHTEIPKTPPKLKSFNKKLSFNKKSKISIKSRVSFEGIERLNILQHLEDVLPALDNILLYLNGEDLLKAESVCHSWKRIINNNPKSRLKKKIYKRFTLPIKENKQKRKNFENKLKLKSEKLTTPFSSQNLNINRKRSLEPHSPPVSPSKRMFYENQKIVRKLDRNATLTKCPRCYRSSEIKSFGKQQRTTPNSFTSSPRKLVFRSNKRGFSMPTPTKIHEFNEYLSTKQSTSTRTRSFSLHSFTSPISMNCTIFPSELSTDSESPESILLNNTALLDFAICTRPTCKFKFCLRCYCEFLPDHDCLLIEPLSPTYNNKDDEITPKKKTIIGSKQSKLNLKRLC